MTSLLHKCLYKKTKPKSEWHKPQDFIKSYSQQVVVEETRSEPIVSFFCGAQIHSMKKVKPEVILVSGSKISLAKDEGLLTNIRECEESILMQKNVGTKDVTPEGDDELAEIVYFCPSALTNLYGVSDIVKKGNHVYIDTRK